MSNPAIRAGKSVEADSFETDEAYYAAVARAEMRAEHAWLASERQ